MTPPPRPPQPPPAAPVAVGAGTSVRTPPAGTRSRRARLDGVDLARALAIVGMVAVHVLPLVAPAPGVYGWSFGRASALFAVVAGVGIALLAARRPVREVRARLVYRMLWLAPLGIWLDGLDHPVAVILQYYAVWFLLTAFVVGWSTRTLAVWTGVGLLVGPTLLVVARVLRPGWYAPPGTGAWLGTVGDVLLTGYYPTVAWWWLVLLGLVVGRLDLRRTRVAGGLLGGGAAVAALAYGVADALRESVDLGRWDLLLATTVHWDGPLRVLAVGGVAVAVLGACLLLCAALPRAPLRPLVALGRLALTVYVGHLLVYAATPEVLRSATVAEATRTVVVFTLVTAALSTAWLAVAARGPLESLERTGFERLVRPLLATERAAEPPPPPPPPPVATP